MRTPPLTTLSAPVWKEVCASLRSWGLQLRSVCIFTTAESRRSSVTGAACQVGKQLIYFALSCRRPRTNLCLLLPKHHDQQVGQHLLLNAFSGFSTRQPSLPAEACFSINLVFCSTPGTACGLAPSW